MIPPPLSGRCPVCDKPTIEHGCVFDAVAGRAEYIFCGGREIHRSEFTPASAGASKSSGEGKARAHREVAPRTYSEVYIPPGEKETPATAGGMSVSAEAPQPPEDSPPKCGTSICCDCGEDFIHKPESDARIAELEGLVEFALPVVSEWHHRVHPNESPKRCGSYERWLAEARRVLGKEGGT